jgi:PKD repeat protein
MKTESTFKLVITMLAFSLSTFYNLIQAQSDSISGEYKQVNITYSFYVGGSVRVDAWAYKNWTITQNVNEIEINGYSGTINNDNNFQVSGVLVGESGGLQNYNGNYDPNLKKISGTFTGTVARIGADSKKYIDEIFNGAFSGTKSTSINSNFSGTPVSGIAPLTVQFTDQSTGNITSRLWDFGDGQTNTSVNPSHTYQNVGTYTVKLTAKGPEGSNTKTRTNYINVSSSSTLVANFSGTPTSGIVPLTIHFTDQSTGNITSRLWDFGDGSTSTLQNPSHTYTTVEIFTVSLTVTGNAESDIETKSAYINVLPSGGRPNLVINSGLESSTGWTIYDMGGNDKSIAEFNYIENVPSKGEGGCLRLHGNSKYTHFLIWQKITLTGGETYEFNAAFKDLTGGNLNNFWSEVYISQEAPVEGQAWGPLNGTLSDQLVGFDSWSGCGNNIDGTYEDDGCSPGKGSYYTAPGAGPVIVYLGIKTGVSGESAISYDIAIDEVCLWGKTSGAAPVADFEADKINIFVNDIINFADLSSGIITDWSWDFGDGSTSTEENPSHIYTAAGNYTVSLTVTGDDGTDTETKTDYIYARDFAGVTFPINNLIYGAVGNSADFMCTCTIAADADSVYLQFDIEDDIIVSAGNNWQVDNIEIYFDMDNSKNISWPRVHNWIANDPIFDLNDYQLRLVPGLDFAAINSIRPNGQSIDNGYRQVYQSTGTGYVFILNIAWDALLEGYTPNTGSKIGFDIDASDCDQPSAVNDANRNQLTLSSPFLQIYNDPSLWAELEFTSEGVFRLNPDNEPPTDPTGLSATVNGKNVVLRWDPSTDNRAVMSYKVLKDDNEIADVLAMEADNNYFLTDLDIGSYTFSIKAVDNFGNLSGKASASTIVNGIDDYISINQPTIFPNPASNELNVINVKTETVINIYSAMGQLVISRTIAGHCIIDITSLRNGMYILQWSNSDETSTIKLIKQ